MPETRFCLALVSVFVVEPSALIHQNDAHYRCYSCSSENGDNCSVISANTSIITCKNGCTKIRTQPLLGDPTYTRGCSASKHFNGCESINIIGNMKKECDCKRNLCNRGSGMVPTTMLPLLGPLLYLKL